ncbi:MAG: J domain-containing protein, partial [Candidatus Zixiibacteriota bacterium]
IHSSVEISFVEAIKGCKKNVKTLAKTVTLTVPPGTQPGTKLRLKGMGLAVNGRKGDQYVEIKVRIPENLTENQKRLLDEWE